MKDLGVSLRKMKVTAHISKVAHLLRVKFSIEERKLFLPKWNDTLSYVLSNHAPELAQEDQI